MAEPRIGLVLSGGGAAGIAHVPVLQAFDDLGLRPAAVAGVSMGALVGAGFASGMSGAALRAHFMELGRRPSAQIWKIAMQGALGFNRGMAAVDARRFLETVLPAQVPGRFEDLAEPLCVTATDYHGCTLVPFSRGDLWAAVAASIAVPGVFRPVVIDGAVYVDGGVIDNLPLRHLPEVDLVVAVNVLSDLPRVPGAVPGQVEAAVASLRTMMVQQIGRSIAADPPDLLVVPQVRAGAARGLWQVSETLALADPVRARVRAALERMIGALARGEAPGRVRIEGARDAEPV